MYVVCRHAKLKSLVTSIALQQIREADAGFKQEQVLTMHNIECTCKMQWYNIVTLSLVILGLMVFLIINIRKLKLLRGHMFSNAVKIMLFISNTQYYVLVKLCRTAGSIYLFKMTGNLTSEQITLKRKLLWVIIEIDWKEVNMTLNENKVHLPKSVTIPLRDKVKIRWIIRRVLASLYHVEQGMTWFSLEIVDNIMQCAKQPK